MMYVLEVAKHKVLLTSNYEARKVGFLRWRKIECIFRSTEEANSGYFEDRRPGSNMDPYLVTSIIFETTVLK